MTSLRFSSCFSTLDYNDGDMEEEEEEEEEEEDEDDENWTNMPDEDSRARGMASVVVGVHSRPLLT